MTDDVTDDVAGRDGMTVLRISMLRALAALILGSIFLGCSPFQAPPLSELDHIEYGPILDVDRHIRSLSQGNERSLSLHVKTNTGDEAEVRISEGYLQISFSKCSGRNARLEKRIVDGGNASGFIVILFDSNVTCPNITLSRKWVSPENNTPVSSVLVDIFKVSKKQRTMFQWKDMKPEGEK